MIRKGFEFYDECKKDNVGAYAAQSAFFIILSALPFLMVIFSLLKYTFIGKADFLQIVQAFCPDYVLPFMIVMIDEVYEHSAGVLSITAIAAIWSAAKGLQYITNGLNAVYDVDENRNWFVLRFWAIIYTLIFALAILFMLGFIVFGNYVKSVLFQKFPHTAFLTFFGSWMKRLFGLLILIVFFIVIFTALPNKKLHFKGQIVGACFTAAGWTVFSYGLSIYVDYFNGFSMYRSLTTLMLLMLWVYFCVYIMLIGGELNAFLTKA